MVNLPEIVIILVIVVIVFGVGKVGNIGAQLGKAKKSFKKALDGEMGADAIDRDEFIDITPSDDEPDESHDPKPGTRKHPIEDAEVESPNSF